MKKENDEIEQPIESTAEKEDGTEEENKIPNIVIAGDSSGYIEGFILIIILIGTVIGGLFYGLISLFKKESNEDDSDNIG